MIEAGEFDAVVVGAGAGGAAAAWRMTQRGWRVLLLDAGPAFDPATDYGLSRDDWERQRFIQRVGMQTLRSTQHSSQSLYSDAHNIVFRLLRSE